MKKILSASCPSSLFVSPTFFWILKPLRRRKWSARVVLPRDGNEKHPNTLWNLCQSLNLCIPPKYRCRRRSSLIWVNCTFPPTVVQLSAYILFYFFLMASLDIIPDKEANLDEGPLSLLSQSVKNNSQVGVKFWSKNASKDPLPSTFFLLIPVYLPMALSLTRNFVRFS